MLKNSATKQLCIDPVICLMLLFFSPVYLWLSHLIALSHLTKSPASDSCFRCDWYKLSIGNQSTLCLSQKDWWAHQ